MPFPFLAPLAWWRRPGKPVVPVPLPTKLGQEHSPLSRWATTWWSRLYNGLRLLGASRQHGAYIRTSRKVVRTLRQVRGPDAPAKVFGYLRRIDPLLFEEVVLTAIEERGVVVKRSLRYSGDGGADGFVKVPGLGLVACQSKRYSRHINKEHARDFARMCSSKKLAGGWFFHTGLTGAGSRQALAGPKTRIISGALLLELLCT